MKASRAPGASSEDKKEGNSPVLRRHLRFGWWCLLVFLTLGLALETMHGFKVEAYLRVSNETRRFMWTLAHAHGTLLAILNLVFAASLRFLSAWPESRQNIASLSLVGATALMPAGFFLGGIFVYGGDPGIGILLLPIGGVLLFVAVLLTAIAAQRM